MFGVPITEVAPTKSCFSESITGNCLSGFSRWHTFTVGNCLCRHWVFCLPWATGHQCWKATCIFKCQGNRQMKDPELGSEEHRNDGTNSKLIANNKYSCWCEFPTQDKASSYLCYNTRMCVMGNKSTCPWEGGGKSINECLGMSSTCQDVDLLILIYLNEKRLGNTNHLVSNHYRELCDLKWQQRWLGEWNARYTLQFSYWRLKSWEGNTACITLESYNRNLWSMGGSEGFQASRG